MTTHRVVSHRDFELGGGTHLHARVVGSGPPVLLLHGWATNAALYGPVLEQWPAGSTAIALDLRGTGYSFKPEHGYALADFAEDIGEVLDQLAEPTVLVGHSMGGLIAMRVALDHEEFVSGCVLLSPVPAGGVPLPDEQVQAFETLAGRQGGLATVIRSMISAEVDQVQVEALIAACASTTTAAFCEGFAAWRGANFAEELGTLQCPILVTAGECEQPLTPAVIQQAVTDLLPTARMHVFAGCGHYPQLECTSELVATLTAEIVALCGPTRATRVA